MKSIMKMKQDGSRLFWFLMFLVGCGVGFSPSDLCFPELRDALSTEESSEMVTFLDGDKPCLRDVVVVMRKSAGLQKGMDVLWEKRMEQIDAVSVEPMFPTQRENETDLSKIFQIRMKQGSDVRKAVNVLNQDPFIEWAEPVYLRELYYNPNDTDIAKQWHIDKVKARNAWDVFRGDTTVVIGIVDTGVDWDHPDLAKNIWRNPGEIPNNGMDDDGNGYIDDIRGWDFGNYDNDPRPDLSGHGTFVAGVAGAVTNNGTGIAAPAFNAKVMPVKLSVETVRGLLMVYNWPQCIEYAVNNGAHIINCSFGGEDWLNAERAVIAYAQSKGVLIVAAAGNDFSETPSYPASYPGVLSVAATDKNDRKTDFSTWDYTVDVSAPGENIYTTEGSKDYITIHGTSLSSPLTASIAALVKGYHPDWDGMRVGEQVRISADPINGVNIGYEYKLGSGRVNAQRALTVVSPSIRLTDYHLVEGTGCNGDGIFDPGEEIRLTYRIKNFLQPTSGITVTMKTDNPYVTFLNPTFTLSSLGTLEEKGNETNPVRIQIQQGAPRGQQVDVLAEIRAAGGYTDFDYLNFDISFSHAVIRGGNVLLTVTSTGRLGFVDFPNNQQGKGFVFGYGGNLLFEGAVMAAVSKDSVSDMARGAVSSTQDKDFDTAVGGEILIHKPGALADEQGIAVFTDERASPSLGLRIEQASFGFNDSLNGNYILLSYKISRLSNKPLRGLYFGLFMDWDVGHNGLNARINLPGYEQDLRLGYIYDKISSMYGGLCLMNESGLTVYKSLINTYDLYGGYTDVQKWEHLSGGIQETSNPTVNDYSHVLGVGPLRLGPFETAVVGFAVLGAESLENLRMTAFAAKAKWNELFEQTRVGEEESGFAPMDFGLEDNYPNPFNPETTIGYDLPEKSRVILTIIDVLGRELYRLVDAEQAPGHHEVQWDGRTTEGTAASGVYLYRLQAGSFEKVKKMALLR